MKEKLNNYYLMALMMLKEVDIFIIPEKENSLTIIFRGLEMILEFEAYAEVDNNTAIAISNEVSGIFEVNIPTGNCTFIDLIPNEKVDKKRLYSKALYINNKVYFVPLAANEIAVFDVKTKEIYKIKLKEVVERDKDLYKKNSKFNDGVIYKDYIYMTPCTYPGIIRINIYTDCVEYFEDWVGEKPYSFRKVSCIDNNMIYLPSVLDNTVLIFDMESGHASLKHIGINNNGSWSICKKDEEFWFAPKNQGSIIKWNPKTKKIIEYNKYPENFEGNDFLFTKSFVYNDFLYMIPAFANMAIKIDCITGEMYEFEIEGIGNNTIVFFMFENADEIYLKISEKKDTKYIKISKIDLSIHKYEFVFLERREEFEKVYFDNRDDLLKESRYFGLKKFLKNIVYTEEDVRKTEVK